MKPLPPRGPGARSDPPATWRLLLVAQAALLVLALGSSVPLVAGARWGPAVRMLGYPGPTVRLVAVTDGASPGSPSPAVSDSLTAYLGEHDLSLAYSPSGAAAVTVDDRRGKFRDLAGSPLTSRLSASGPQALLSTTFVGALNAPTLLPERTAVVGSFRPEVKYEDRYPLVILNGAATSFGAGVYTFAGAGAEQADQLVELLASNGMVVVGGEASVGATLGVALAPPYGPIAAAFLSLTLLLWVLGAWAWVSLSRRWTSLLVVTGASEAHLRRLILSKLVGSAGAGTLVGTSGTVCLAAALSPYALFPPGTSAVGAVSVAVLTGAAALGASSLGVAWATARSRFRGLPA